MKKLLLLFVLFTSFSAFSQKQLFIKGIYPNFYVVHDVAPTETYSSIAKLYNVTALKLADYNKLTLHNGKIFAKTINVPLTTQNFIQRKTTPKNEVFVPVDYVLNPNETVTTVSMKYKVPSSSLVELNNITSQQLYNSGQLTVGYLRVPPSVASFFSLKTEMAARVPEAKKPEPIKKPELTEEEQRAANGVRLAKKRADVVAAIGTTPPVANTDTATNTPPVTQPATSTNAQPVTATQDAVPRSGRLKVYIDCSNTWCDETFFKTEINIVDFLLDRVASDVHMLVTSQENGNGGSQFQMIFYGQNKFKTPAKDTLRFNLDPNATDSERRDLMVKYMKLGLTPFIAKTDFAKDINIQMKQSETEQGANTNTSTKDKWNYWVFRAGASGNISLDAVYKSNSYSGNFSANRTTDKIKIGVSADANENVSKFEYVTANGTEKFTVKNKSSEIEHFLVKSINDHWSIGYEAEYNNSTFSNNKSRYSFRPAIEYSIFPYKEVNNKFFTINYGAGVRYNTYYDTTIYNKTSEVLYGHLLSANLSVNQKWGSVSSSLRYSNFFHNFKLNNLNLYLNVNVRITGGLSVYGYTSGGLVRDQVYLPKGGATEQEILTRRRQLESGYNFYSSFGFSYRFGSKLNNFVNPRFNN